MELEDIKVGKYIRTESGNIEKVRTINFVRYTSYTAKSRGKEELCGYYRPLINGRYEIGDIQNCKESLIELIEVGDYVNGIEVVTVYGYDEDGNDRDENGIIEVDDDYAYGVYLKDINIVTVATSQQFKKIQQKVGE